MKLNLVPPRTGVLWVRQGLQTFGRQPLAFTALLFFFMAVLSIASVLPLVGGVLALALLPCMTLAQMSASAATAQSVDKPAAGSVFFAALQAVRQDFKPLLALGLVYALCFIVLLGVSALADGGQFARVYLLGGSMTREMAEQPEVQMALWIAIVLYLPLSLAFWHAPALLHWHRVPVAKCIFFSVVACFRNFGALTVFGIVWMGVFIATGIVISLVTGLVMAVGGFGGGEAVSALASVVMMGGALVMAAMFFSSVWFTFRDCFSAD